MNKFYLQLILLLIIISACASTPTNAQIRKQPNLLFVFPDQYRAQAMGFTNEDPVQTPNIDKLARQGIVFKNAVSNRPLCSPFRAMLMTGKYAFNNGVQTNCNTSSRRFGNFLKTDEVCFGDALKTAGYYAGYIGKWHLDAPEGPDVENWQDAIWDAFTPKEKRHGFDFWHAYGCHNRHNDPYYWTTNASIKDTLYPKKWSPIHEAEVAMDFIAENKEKPWALFVSMNPPHGPYNEVPQKYREIYENISVDSLLNRGNVPEGKRGDIGRKNVIDYFACVTGVDEQIGRILDKLEETGQSENTIVVFTADHGEMMGSHGLLQKVVWYEESFRIPFIMRWPAKLTAGVNDLHLSVPDIMPSILSLMGLDAQIPEKIEGENYAGVIRGESSEKPDFSLYLNCGYPNPKGGLRGIRTNRYTFVVQKDKIGNTKNYKLFDNLNDRFQQKNIADEKPELIEEFELKMMNKLSKINDPWSVED